MERRELRRWRFFGVIRMMMVKLWSSSWWVRSKSGIMWPCAEYGKMRRCASLPDEIVILVSVKLLM